MTYYPLTVGRRLVYTEDELKKYVADLSEYDLHQLFYAIDRKLELEERLHYINLDLDDFECTLNVLIEHATEIATTEEQQNLIKKFCYCTKEYFKSIRER